MMPIDYGKYSKDWKKISQRIREREGQKCKWCQAPNRTWINRLKKDLAVWIPWIDWLCLPYEDRDLYRDQVMVVLTVAHLNHDTTDNRDENLAAICQLCHLRYDAKHHTSNAKRTRAAKKAAELEANGQLSLFGEAV